MWHCLADEAGNHYLLCLLDYYNYPLLPTENQRDLCRILQKQEFPSTIAYICCNVARKRETKKVQRKVTWSSWGFSWPNCCSKAGSKAGFCCITCLIFWNWGWSRRNSRGFSPVGPRSINAMHPTNQPQWQQTGRERNEPLCLLEWTAIPHHTNCLSILICTN